MNYHVWVLYESENYRVRANNLGGMIIEQLGGDYGRYLLGEDAEIVENEIEAFAAAYKGQDDKITEFTDRALSEYFGDGERR